MRFECDAESAVHFVEDVLGDVFGGWVEAAGGLVEGCGFVEVGVVEFFEDGIERGFGGVEVADEAVLIEPIAPDFDGGEEVVAVERFALASDGESVSGGEGGLDGDGEHGARVGG